MKNKLKYILLVIGVAVVIFGALIPTIFSGKSLDRYTYDLDGSLSNYELTVNVISKEEYIINSATITLQDAFDKYNTLDKTITSPSVTKKKDGKDFVYTFTINLTQAEFFDYSKVSNVVVDTNIGTRIAEEKPMFNVNWRIPVMIFVIIIGSAAIIVSICLNSADRNQKKYADRVRKELAQTNPEINTTNMTDEEVINKKFELKRKGQEQTSFMSMFGIEQKPKEKVCEYCGAVNGADATKCSSCGANLKAEK